MIKNLFSLEGKSVAVIGAGSGIGQAVAIGTAQQGAYVCCLDINTDNASETAAMITKAGGAADAGTVDITNADVGKRCDRDRRREAQSPRRRGVHAGDQRAGSRSSNTAATNSIAWCRSTCAATSTCCNRRGG